jgi:hypothetical protein
MYRHLNLYVDAISNRNADDDEKDDVDVDDEDDDDGDYITTLKTVTISVS